MSKPKPTRSPGSLNSTRQMLDELDALMERMLSLPVTDLEQNPSAAIDVGDRQHLAASLTVLEPPPAPTPSPPQPLDSVTASQLESPTLRVDPSSVPVVRGPKKQPPAPQPAASDLPDAEDPDDDALPPLIIRRPAASSSVPQRVRPRWSLFYLRPLFWINQVYDSGTWWLGPAGQWLRGRRGRTVLGLAGLTFLGVAAVWCLRDWLGWNR